MSPRRKVESLTPEAASTPSPDGPPSAGEGPNVHPHSRAALHARRAAQDADADRWRALSERVRHLSLKVEQFGTKRRGSDRLESMTADLQEIDEFVTRWISDLERRSA